MGTEIAPLIVTDIRIDVPVTDDDESRRILVRAPAARQMPPSRKIRYRESVLFGTFFDLPSPMYVSFLTIAAFSVDHEEDRGGWTLPPPKYLETSLWEPHSRTPSYNVRNSRKSRRKLWIGRSTKYSKLRIAVRIRVLPYVTRGIIINQRKKKTCEVGRSKIS